MRLYQLEMTKSDKELGTVARGRSAVLVDYRMTLSLNFISHESVTHQVIKCQRSTGDISCPLQHRLSVKVSLHGKLDRKEI